MNKKYTIFILIVSVLYVVYHLVTLSYSPLPWFDEVSYASITNSYIKSRTFYQEAIAIVTPGQNAMYGPVFFALQAWVIKLLGWSMFNFRLSNLLFGLINLYMVYRICLYLKFKPYAIIITLLILAFDRSYNQFLHSGRMDFMTIFFFLASYLVFTGIDPKGGSRWILLTVFTGFLLSCAALTTPRILFAFSFYCCYFFYELYENRQGAIKNTLLKYAIILLTFVSFFYLWIYYEFGSLHNYVYVNYTSNEIVKRHVGFSKEEMKFNAGILYFAYALFCVALLFVKKQAYQNIKLLLFTVPVIASFLFLVGGGFAGRYYAMIAPFTTLLIVGVTANIYDNMLFKGINYAIIGLLVLGFIFKGFYVFATWQERDPVYNEHRIMQYIPKGSSIAGDFEYYYFARRNNCFFQSLKENGLPGPVVQYFTSRNFDYFIFDKTNVDVDYYKTFILKDRYKLLTTIEDKPKPAWLQAIINKMGYRISESYSCSIYKYVGNSPNLPPAGGSQ